MVNSSFACLALLEAKVCELYELMVEKADNVDASLLLDVILQESRKHRELLTHICQVTDPGSSPSLAECEEQLGYLFERGVSLLESIKDKIQRGTPVTQVAGELLDFEKSASEEYLTAAYARIEAYTQSSDAIKKILEGIAEDEKGHVELLKLVANMNTK